MKRKNRHIGVKERQARANSWLTSRRRHSGQLTSRSNLFRSMLGVVFLSLLLAGCGGSGNNTDTNTPQVITTPTFEIDQALEPAVETITFVDGSGSRPVASIADNKGNRADFVEDEVIVALDDPSKLDALLARLNAVVLREIGPPAIAGIPVDFPTFYLLRIDPATASPTELAELIIGRGGEGDAGHRISSQRGLDMLSAIAREDESAGTQLGANFLLTYESDGSDLSRRTMMESPTATSGAGYTQDAFQWPYMDRGSLQDIGAAEAARLVHDAGKIPAPGDEIRFLIIDAGFSSGADYASPVLPGASALDTPNPYDCGGGPCPWHGTAVASTALSVFNDGLGGAGPAAEVALPIFMQSPTPNFWDVLEYILVTIPAAIGVFPDIINISASADIPSGACLTGACAALDAIGLGLHGAGILVFSSAGNDGARDIDAEDCFIDCWESGYIAPCEMPGVTCVGGMQHASRDRHPNSSWGSQQDSSDGSVDIYAPYSVWVHDDPDGGTTNAIMVNGTSFSSPFVASIAALIKAADPSLGPGAVWALMRDNAHTEGGVGVHRWINAYGAVRAALDGNAPPFAQITSPSEGAEYSWNVAYAPLYCGVDDDGDAAALSFAWSSNLDGTIGGTTASTNSGPLPSLGVHEITCTVTDGFYTVSDTISINVVNDAPSITITSPAAPAEFFFGQAIALTSTPADINDNLAGVAWEVRRASTTIWSGVGLNTTIPAGTLPPFLGYDLVATVTDTEGASSVAVRELRINPDPEDIPPSITDLTITPDPADDPSDNPPGIFYVDPCGIDVNGAEPGNGWCQFLTFSATINDDNPLPNSGPPFYFPTSMTWELYESGSLVDTRTTDSDTSFALVAGNYRLVLTVTDSAGQSTTVNWFFSIRTLT